MSTSTRSGTIAPTPAAPTDGGERHSGGRAPSGRKAAARHAQWVPLWLLSPAGLVMAFVTATPIVLLVLISVTDYDQRSLFTGEFQLVGLEQYTRIFFDAEFWWSLLRTVGLTVAMVTGSMLIGTAVAQLMTTLATGMRYVVTVVLICAWAMPNVASSLVWNWLFQPGYGVVNWLLTQLGIFGDLTQVSWADDPLLAPIAICALVIWQAVPFIALTVYAAQIQVPAEYYEAARLDGAGEWRVYRSITLPFLRPTLMLITILSVIWDYNVFNQIWLVSEGGPDGATTTLGIYTYKTAFVGFDLGEGAAISLITTLILLWLTGIYIRNLVRSGEDL